MFPWTLCLASRFPYEKGCPNSPPTKTFCSILPRNLEADPASLFFGGPLVTFQGDPPKKWYKLQWAFWWNFFLEKSSWTFSGRIKRVTARRGWFSHQRRNALGSASPPQAAGCREVTGGIRCPTLEVRMGINGEPDQWVRYFTYPLVN